MTACTSPLLDARFDQPPADTGWTPYQNSDSPTWVGPPTAAIDPGEGHWNSPKYPVTFPNWQRITLDAHASKDWCYVGAKFFGEDGSEFAADHYDQIEATDGFAEHVYYVRAKANAVQGQLRFTANVLPKTPPGKLLVRAARVDDVDDAAVHNWHQHEYAKLPAMNVDLPDTHWVHLPRTKATLDRGGALRVVLLGDSIANDTGSSPWDIVLEKRFPGVKIEAITSVRGGTGCWYYAKDNRVQQYVFDYKPDLVIVMGISHREKLEPVREVIKQIRAKGDEAPEVLVMNGAITTESQPVSTFAHTVPTDQAIIRNDLFARQLSKVAAEEGVAFANLRQVWRDYLASQDHDAKWFRRDAVHANTRGRHIMARILAGLLSPPAPAD